MQMKQPIFYKESGYGYNRFGVPIFKLEKDKNYEIEVTVNSRYYMDQQGLNARTILDLNCPSMGIVR